MIATFVKRSRKILFIDPGPEMLTMTKKGRQTLLKCCSAK